MKMLNKVALATAALATFGAAGAANAATATATANAKIVKAITMTQTQNMDFGTIVTGATAATAVLGLANSVTCGVGLTCSGAPKVAAFDVQGTNGASVLTTLPADGAVTLTSGANSMVLTGFTSNWGVGAHTLVTTIATADSLKVGATLGVGANQAEGNYVGSFAVTVNYQ
jgi:hypothetical protein